MKSIHAIESSPRIFVERIVQNLANFIVCQKLVEVTVTSYATHNPSTILIHIQYPCLIFEAIATIHEII